MYIASTGTHCKRENGQDTAHVLQILLWIYSNVDSPPTPTFTQDTCTLLCLFCVGAKSSNSLLSVVFHRAILAIPRSWSLERHLQAFLFCFAILRVLQLLMSVSLLLATRNPLWQLWEMLCCLARLSSGLMGILWEKQCLAAGEQEQTQAGSADISGMEGSWLWANWTGTLLTSLWGYVQSKQSLGQTANCSSIFLPPASTGLEWKLIPLQSALLSCSLGGSNLLPLPVVPG